MSDILTDTCAALFTTLAAGTGLTALLAAGSASIYDTAPSENAAFPYVLYNHSGGGPESITSASLENNLWFVRAYSSADTPASAGSIFAQIDALLDRKSLTIGSRKTLYCWRETNVKARQLEPTARPVWVAGAYYRLRTSGT